MQRKAKLINSLQTDETLLKNFSDQNKSNFDTNRVHVMYLLFYKRNRPIFAEKNGSRQ